MRLDASAPPSSFAETARYKRARAPAWETFFAVFALLFASFSSSSLFCEGGGGCEDECCCVVRALTTHSPSKLTLSATAASHWRSSSSLYMAPKLVANFPGAILRLTLLSFSYCAASWELVT